MPSFKKILVPLPLAFASTWATFELLTEAKKHDKRYNRVSLASEIRRLILQEVKLNAIKDDANANEPNADNPSPKPVQVPELPRTDDPAGSGGQAADGDAVPSQV